MRVLKFGGSSVADPARIEAVATIIVAHQARGPVVAVSSAMAGVTDGLLRVGHLRLARQPGWQSELEAVGDRHRAAYHALGVAVPERFEQLWQAALADADRSERAQEGEAGVVRFSGWGERLVVDLVATALTRRGVVAEAFTWEPVLLGEHTGADATSAAGQSPAPSVLATRAWLVPRLAQLVARGGIPVLPGYIARDAAGRGTTLGRNGSDYSAAVVAAALGAEQLVIYSDVAGVYSADPHLVPEALPLPWLTYSETASIAELGATVVHPRTVDPLARWGIPLDLRSADAPTARGTAVLPTLDATRAEQRGCAWVVAARSAPQTFSGEPLAVISALLLSDGARGTASPEGAAWLAAVARDLRADGAVRDLTHDSRVLHFTVDMADAVRAQRLAHAAVAAYAPCVGAVHA